VPQPRGADTALRAKTAERPLDGTDFSDYLTGSFIGLSGLSCDPRRSGAGSRSHFTAFTGGPSALTARRAASSASPASTATRAAPAPARARTSPPSPAARALWLPDGQLHRPLRPPLQPAPLRRRLKLALHHLHRRSECFDCLTGSFIDLSGLSCYPRRPGAGSRSHFTASTGGPSALTARRAASSASPASTATRAAPAPARARTSPPSPAARVL